MAARMPKIEQVQMMKCDACGSYHPVSECEVVVIKMVKGKNCVLSSTPLQPISAPTPTPAVAMKSTTSVVQPSLTVPTESADTQIDTTAPGFDGIQVPPLDPLTPVANAQKRRNIIPNFAQSAQARDMIGHMIPNDNPLFESKGAKETRRV